MAQHQKFLSLTALWAFVEAGLGGFLHAFHLPFTGLVLGGFALLIISLIAHFCTPSFQKIIQATLIVLAIKVIVNPATSPMAYIAVGFQGILGACIYRFSHKHFVAHFLFATISMLESGAQKLLVMTLLFGKTFWQGVDGLGKQIGNIFIATSNFTCNYYLIFIYLGIFCVWGIVLSFYMHRLPTLLLIRKNNFTYIIPSIPSENNLKKKKSYLLLIITIIILAICSVFFAKQNGFITGIFYIIRTAGILAIWQIVILPIWQKTIAKWGTHFGNNNADFIAVQQLIPNIASFIKPLYKDVANQYTGIKKWKEFILGLMVITLYHNHE